MALSAKEVAREFGVDARTFRKFMRAILPKEEQPGQGHRYRFEEKELKKLRKRFDEWRSPKADKTEVDGQITKARRSRVDEIVDIIDNALED
jgi:hypothetical protein